MFLLRLNIQCPTLFRSAKEYMAQFYERGGIIEAQAPSGGTQSIQVSFLITPDGNYQVMGSFDKVSTAQTSNRMALYMQSQLSHLNYDTLVSQVSSALYQKGVMGYVSMDLVYFNQQDVLQQLKQPALPQS